MNQEARLDYLIHYLLHEKGSTAATFDQITVEEKIELFRGLCNERPAEPVTDSFLTIQDEFLTQWNNDRPLISLEDLTPIEQQLFIWQGDITSIVVDAIVNAANSSLIGCTIPNHTCIDNIIHTRAGVQLRLDGAEIIQSQGRKEPIGKAKLTKAYNLPANYIIHTVGPFIDERGVSSFKEHLLVSSYRSCLLLADKHQLSTIAFCCISTGEFNFPNQRAAELAIQTVQDYIQETNSTIKVIFNVFTDEDLHIYHSLLEQ